LGRYVWIGGLFFFYWMLLTDLAEAAAPAPYFGKEEGDLLANRPDREDLELPLIGQLGGEWIDTKDGKNDERLLLLSWEKDFIIDWPTISFLNVLVESDESRFVLEFPETIVNPYLALIAEYPYFYRFDQAGVLQADRFLGTGLGGGLMKRTEAVNYRFGGEWVGGVLKGEGQRDKGQKLTLYAQVERDRLRRAQYDQPVEGTRFFFSFAQQYFKGFASESRGGGFFLEGAEEWYYPYSEKTVLGFIAREGRDSRPIRFWRTTLGSFQGDNFNVPLPGYLYQQFPADEYLSGEINIQTWLTSFFQFHLGYHVAGGWDDHIYASTSTGGTLILFGELPLVIESALGHAPSGALELLIGTAIQW